MSTIIGHNTQKCVPNLRELLETLSVEDSARLLLGCHLVTSECRVRLVEVEAYSQADDPGSHAHRGPTPRNKVMFGPAGRLYTYFTYGNHWMANVVCRPEGEASAVLIRAAEPLEGLEEMWMRRPKARTVHDLVSGPGKVCAALALDSAHYGLDLLDPDSPVRIEAGSAPREIIVSTRIGLSPGKGEEQLRRFVDASSLEWCSKPYPAAR